MAYISDSCILHSTRITHPLWARHSEPLNIRKCPRPLSRPHSVAGALHSFGGEPEGSATLPGPTGHLFGGSELEGDPSEAEPEWDDQRVVLPAPG